MEEISQVTETQVNSHGESSGGLFSIDPGLMIWTWLVFALLFIILSKFVWKPMMESVRRREQTLKDAVENARKTKEELEKISQRQEAMISQAEQKAKEIINEAKIRAEDVSRAIIDKAKDEAAKTMERIKEEMDAEREKAISEIRAQAVDMIIATSEKILKKNLDDKTQRDFIMQELNKK